MNEIFEEPIDTPMPESAFYPARKWAVVQIVAGCIFFLCIAGYAVWWIFFR